MSFDLGAMLADVSKSDTREQIEYIPLENLESDPNNFYQLSGVEDLASNIALCGVQQPIRVRPGQGGHYIIVSGHRRRAALESLAKEDPSGGRMSPASWSGIPSPLPCSSSGLSTPTPTPGP